MNLKGGVTMTRRKGYMEAEYEAVIKRKKREHRKQTLVAVSVIGMFTGLLYFIFLGLWIWANGGM